MHDKVNWRYVNALSIDNKPCSEYWLDGQYIWPVKIGNYVAVTETGVFSSVSIMGPWTQFADPPFPESSGHTVNAGSPISVAYKSGLFIVYGYVYETSDQRGYYRVVTTTDFVTYRYGEAHLDPYGKCFNVGGRIIFVGPNGIKEFDTDTLEFTDLPYPPESGSSFPQSELYKFGDKYYVALSIDEGHGLFTGRHVYMTSDFLSWEKVEIITYDGHDPGSFAIVNDKFFLDARLYVLEGSTLSYSKYVGMQPFFFDGGRYYSTGYNSTTSKSSLWASSDLSKWEQIWDQPAPGNYPQINNFIAYTDGIVTMIGGQCFIDDWFKPSSFTFTGVNSFGSTVLMTNLDLYE